VIKLHKESMSDCSMTETIYDNAYVIQYNWHCSPHAA